VNILYLNHTGELGGGERSLLELLAGLPSSVSPSLACPGGALSAAAKERGVTVWRVPGTEASLKLRPLDTARGLANVLRTAYSVRTIARRTGAELVHANSIRAGLIASLAARMGAPPVIVYVRDCLPAGASGQLVRRIISSGAALILANSRHTAANFALGAGEDSIRVVYPSVDTRLFDPERTSRREARTRLGLDPSAPVLGVVAQLTPWKAQDDAVRSLALVRDTWPDTQLLFVGGVKFHAARYDNEAYEAALHGLTSDLGVEEAVTFLGERTDIPEILRALDVVLVPSWEEPFGRTVIEAMAMGTPVIATSVGGPAEIVSSGTDGLLLPPRDPAQWAECVCTLLAHPEVREEMGRQGRVRVISAFGREAEVDAVLETYERVLAHRGHSSARSR
jgi:L-malate glycosyltransferase